MSEQLVRRFIEAVDSGGVEGPIATLTPDVVYRFGNAPPIIGHEAFRKFSNAFFDHVVSIKHDIVDIWSSGDCWIFETKVTYLDKYGRTFICRACNVQFEQDGLFREVRVFVDNHELFIPPAS